LGPADLTAALSHLRPQPPDERVLVGHETHDDAGVFRLDDETALVQTVDFFTPVVDDPRTFGAIAAVNALSDIYAMGARPLTALNLVAFPTDRLGPDVLAEMMQGGQDVLAQVGVALLGGHSIDDREPKIGYAVTGIAHPDRIWRNSTARSGDDVYLTKPIGTGVLIKAIKEQRADPAWETAATAAMLTLNRDAAAVLHRVGGPSACTDVTGFGLLGHTWEMAEAAGVRIVVEADQVPVLPGARELADQDAFPAGSRNNRRFFEPHLENLGVPDPLVSLLFDAVTAGGLLFTLEPARREELREAAEAAGITLYRIGRVEAGPARLVLVLRA
jgi:selenide,water dikinase